MKVRRVITGHDASGKAVVKIDEIVKDLKVGRPGAMVAPIWITEGFPVDNDGSEDTSKRQVGTTLAGGTVLRVVEFSPGVQARNHRTDSSTTPSSCPARSTWKWTARLFTSKPATSSCNAAPSIIGSITAPRRVSSPSL